MDDPAVAGGGVPKPRAAQQARGRRRIRQVASLPLDVVLDIAARTDPATLVRCAATCSDLRSRVADPGFLRCLRLRHADRFVPSLLRGHLIGDGDYEYRFRREAVDRDKHLYLLDTAAGRLCRAAKAFPPGPDGEPLRLYRPVSAREGLVLVHEPRELRVCDLATGRSQPFPPPEPEFEGQYVLLVGDDGEGGAVGRHFQVVKASLVLDYHHHHRHLKVQTFSSELGAWGPCAEMRTPTIDGHARHITLQGNPLVVAGAVHWLCLTQGAGYVLKLRVRAAAAPRLTVTKLPDNYPYNGGWLVQHLMATMAAGGAPAVLVADGKKISAWTQSKHTARWSQQPQVVVECAAIAQYVHKMRMAAGLNPELHSAPLEVKLVWFAERSGIVLIRMYNGSFLWLDLQSRAIVKGSMESKIMCKDVYCPYEMGLSTWVPTFGSASL